MNISFLRDFCGRTCNRRCARTKENRTLPVRKTRAVWGERSFKSLTTANLLPDSYLRHRSLLSSSTPLSVRRCIDGAHSGWVFVDMWSGPLICDFDQNISEFQHTSSPNQPRYNTDLTCPLQWKFGALAKSGLALNRGAKYSALFLELSVQCLAEYYSFLFLCCHR